MRFGRLSLRTGLQRGSYRKSLLSKIVFDKEEQELRERKSALELARKLAADKQQKVMEQATVVSDLKLQLVDLRQDTHFYVDVDSNPEVVLFRVLSCCLRCLEIRNFMHELDVAGSVHDEDRG